MNAAPQQMKVELDTGITLTVPDVTKPVWFGPYHDGKLGIYETQVTLPEDATEEQKILTAYSRTYLCTLTETAKGNDFITYAQYVKGVPVENVCQHLQAIVYAQYLHSISKHEPASYVSGNATLQ